MYTIKHLHTIHTTSVDPTDLDLIIAHVLKKSREFVISHPEMNIGLLDYWIINKLVKKRTQGIPLAYLTGHKEFYGLDFFVNKHTLVPRPDTETLVDTTLQHINTTTQKKIILVDIGTGSGCIPISILKNIRKSGLSGNPDCYATDISHPALCIAKKNAKKHNTPITFLHGNLLEPLLKLKPKLPKTYNLIITANLPYLTENQYKKSPSIQHEPKSALVALRQGYGGQIAKNNGLALYEKLFQQINSFPVPPSSSLFLEIDPSQSKSITDLIKNYLPTAHIETKKDLAGRDRVVEIRV